MSKIMKRLTNIIALVLCLTLLPISSFAASSKPDEDAKSCIAELKKQYDIRSLKAAELPDGIIPLAFDTVEEAVAFLDCINKTFLARPSKPLQPLNDNTSPRETRATIYNGSLSKVVPDTDFLGLWEGMGFVTFTWQYVNGQKQFVKCTDFSADFVGTTTFVKFNMQSWYDTMTNTNRTMSITFSGITDIYLSWPGEIILQSIPATSTVDYYASEIS